MRISREKSETNAVQIKLLGGREEEISLDFHFPERLELKDGRRDTFLCH